MDLLTGGRRTFFALQTSPSTNSVFLFFPLGSWVFDEDANVRSTSRMETSRSLPATATVVALLDEDASARTGPSTVFDNGPSTVSSSTPVDDVR